MKKTLIISAIFLTFLGTLMAQETKDTINVYDIKYGSYQTYRQLISPGDYLIKARNNFLIGIGTITLGTVSGIVMTSTIDEQTDSNKANDIMNAAALVQIGSLVVGLSFHIIGIINIGNAGISLNSNGIGIKIPINSK